MLTLEDQAVDIVRAFKKLQNQTSNKDFAISFLATYFKSGPHSTNAPAIGKFIYEHKIAEPIAEGKMHFDVTAVNEFLEKFSKKEYIIDRMFEVLGNHTSTPYMVDQLLNRLFVDFKPEDIRIYEAIMFKTGLVEEGYSFGNLATRSLKLNDDGIIILSEYNSYSAYKKSVEKGKDSQIIPLKKYPIILEAYTPTPIGNVLCESKEIFLHLEEKLFRTFHIARGNIIKDK